MSYILKYRIGYKVSIDGVKHKITSITIEEDEVLYGLDGKGGYKRMTEEQLSSLESPTLNVKYHVGQEVFGENGRVYKVLKVKINKVEGITYYVTAPTHTTWIPQYKLFKSLKSLKKSIDKKHERWNQVDGREKGEKNES